MSSGPKNPMVGEAAVRLWRRARPPTQACPRMTVADPGGKAPCFRTSADRSYQGIVNRQQSGSRRCARLPSARTRFGVPRQCAGNGRNSSATVGTTRGVGAGADAA